MLCTFKVPLGLLASLFVFVLLTSLSSAQTRDTFAPAAHELSADEVTSETDADVEEEARQENDEDERPARRGTRTRSTSGAGGSDTFAPRLGDLSAREIDEQTADDLRRESGEADEAAARRQPSGRRTTSGRNTARNRAAATTASARTAPSEGEGANPRIARLAATTGASAGGRRSTAQQFTITLNNAFIEKYKNRATLTTDFRVMGTRVHTPKEDADEHIAGIADEVGLPCVAEIMNARENADALQAVKDAKASGDVTQVSGAWRIWCEHPGKEPQVQDEPIADFTTSNPDHVFEIHPVSRFGNVDVRDAFHPIDGYEPKEAKRAFTYYESLPCQIVPDVQHQTTTIVTVRAVFNYVEFVMRAEEDQQFATVDGRIVRCSALDLDGNVVATNRRMVSIAGTEPENEVKTMKKGDTLHVLGIPRVDLAVVSWRTRHATDRPEVLTWDLPYEIIVVGVYGDQ